MSRLVEHAVKEIAKHGLCEADADYDGALGVSVLELIMIFASQGHSGGSAELTIEIFNKLVKFEPLEFELVARGDATE